MPIEPIKPELPRVSLAEEKKPEARPKMPPPPKPPEYYPGYRAEAEAVTKNIYQANKRIREAAEALTKVQQRGVAHPLKSIGRGILVGLFPPAGLTAELNRPYSQEDYDAALAEAQAELDAATIELRSTEWRLQVLHTLPAFLSSRAHTIRGIDDIVSLMPNETMSDTDRTWLQHTFKRLEHLNNILPDDFEGTVDEAQSKIVESVLSEPKLALRAVHNLTVDELERSFQPLAVELPEGLSPEDVRGLMSKMELEDEEAEKELEAYLLEQANLWAKETDRINLLRAGLLQAESPELTPLEFAKLMFVQPLMGGIQLLDKYFDMLPRPLASAAIIGVHRLFKTPDDTLAGRMEQIYQYYRNNGESSWAAYAKAINEVDMPWWLRMGIETSFDPTSYIGLGVATAAANKTGSILTRIGLRNIGSRIGPFIGSLENGFIRGSDAIFKAGVEVVLSPIKGSFWLAGAGYRIPKTLTMMSRNFARHTSMNFKAILERLHPEVRNMAGMTAKDIREAAEACIEAALTRPGEGFDDMVRVGTQLLEFEYLDDAAVRKLLKGFIEEGFDIDTIRLARVNDEVLNMFSGQSPKTTAGNILSKLGLEQTEDSVTKVVTRLATLKDDIVDTAMRVFKYDSPNRQLIGMFDNLAEKRYNNLRNPISVHATQAGQTVSWVSRVTDRMLYASHLVNLERKVIMPFARWNLLFANFGPFNFLENMQRSFLGGAEIMYPKSYGGVAETNRLFRGLKNAPYELQMLERGQQRLEMALIDPKTGSTSAFRGGKIPFVTKGVKFRGKDIGKTINIRGVDYKITDFQSYNDMWEALTGIQRAYDYQVQYMKALPEVAPDEMKQITEAVLKRRNELEQITKFSKSDMRDIERVMIQDATVGPEAVAAHAEIDALELERRQISKELGKTFDKCTDVRAMTKQGIRDEVLDGSIFSDIDGRMAAWVEREREMDLVSLTKQIDALQEEAAQFARAYQGKATLLDDLTQDITLGTPEILGAPDLPWRKSPIMLEGEKVGELSYHAGATPDELVVSKIEVSKPGILNRRFMQDMELLIHNRAKEEGASTIKIMSRKGHELMYSGSGYKEVTRGMYVKDVMQPSSHAPQNLDEFLGDMENISAMQNAIDERIHDYRRLVELRSHKLTPGKEVDDFHIGSNRLLNEFMEQSKEQMDSIIDELQEFLTKRPQILGPDGKPLPRLELTEPQLHAVDSLANIYRMENANVLSTRNRLAEIEAKIPRTPPKKRNARFWQQQRADKALIWDEHTINARRLRNLRLDSSRQFLAAVGKTPYLPETLMPVAKELTPSHIAFLFGASGDDAYRGLTRISHHTTVRPREDFIDYVKNQANAYANKFQTTAADLGFTDEAIGEVYDQMWRNLGIEPSMLTPDSPTMMQMEEIRQELIRLHAAVKMDETDIARWRGYVNGVADDVRKMPMYKGVAIKSPEEAVKSGYLVRGGAERPVYSEAGGTWFTESVEYARTYGKELSFASKPKNLKVYDSLDDFLDDLATITNIEELKTSELVALKGRLQKEGYAGIEYPMREFGVNEVWLFERPQLRKLEELAVPEVTSKWWNKKESAMAQARSQHELAYPTYDDANIIDETMRSIFPFWTYEAFRWKWIPRTWMRTPGTMTGLARYMDYTDGGYIPVPGTDLQLNPLRGSIWMGGLRRFYLRDFPEYYDAFPGMEFIDYIGRAGFYPGIHIMGPIVGFGYAAEGKPELGEVAPAWVKTGLSALRALSPEHLGKVIDIVYPDRFRDFQTMLTLGEEGYDADEIWRKKKQNIKLTEEEEKIWLRAEARANGLKGILMEQSGLFRIRPAEYEEVRREMRLAIEEATGVPVRVQEQIDRLYPTTGKRFSDYYKLDVLQQKLLYEFESYRRWQGITTPLYPSSWQALEIKIRDYYETLEKNFNQARREGIYEDGELVRPSIVDLNRQLVSGEIGPDQWRAMRSDIQSKLAEVARVLGETPAYKDVPKTLEEREAWLREKGIPLPTYGPDQELLWYYYELEPEYKYNWDSQRMELDFDTYYSKIDILLDSLNEAQRQRLIDRIQLDWTPMERLYWSVSREYFRPYRNVRSVVLNQYTDEQRQQIRRFEVARGAEREELKQLIGPDGKKLISGFNERVREARQRLRYLDPDLDAWSYFFGNTDTFITGAAKEKYEQLKKRYLTEDMIE